MIFFLAKTRTTKMPHHRLLFTLPPSLSLFFFFFGSFHGVRSAFATICHSVSSLSKCGHIPIQYPFWDVSDNPVHCGYPGLGLNCSSWYDYPTLSLPGDTYFVTKINYVDRTLTLVVIDAACKSCPRARHNLMIGSLPLDYNSANVNLTFFFNCSAPQAMPAAVIDCLRCADKHSYLSMDMSPEETVAIDEAGGYEETVVAAVKRKEVTAANVAEELAGAMSEGFVLDWEAAKECGEGVQRVRALRRAVRIRLGGAGAVLLQRRVDHADG